MTATNIYDRSNVPNLLNPVPTLHRRKDGKAFKYLDRITGHIYTTEEVAAMDNVSLVDESGLPLPPLIKVEKPKRLKRPIKVKGPAKYGPNEGRKLTKEKFARLQQDCYLIMRYNNRKLYDTQTKQYLAGNPLQQLLILASTAPKPLRVIHNETEKDMTTIALLVANYYYGPKGILTTFKSAFREFNGDPQQKKKQRIG